MVPWWQNNTDKMNEMQKFILYCGDVLTFKQTTLDPKISLMLKRMLVPTSDFFPILLVIISYPWEGNGNPLQYSCLENPMDRGAWWATVHGSQSVGHD